MLSLILSLRAVSPAEGAFREKSPIYLLMEI